MPAVGEHLGLRREEALAIDEELDNGAVRAVQDALADAREAIGVLAVGDRPEFIEPVEEHAWFPHRPPFLRRTANAEIAVGQREHRLGLTGIFARKSRIEPGAPTAQGSAGKISGGGIGADAASRRFLVR